MTVSPQVEPVATYRLQLRREFNFADARSIVPYLAGLGISHLYLSPVLQAVPGSAHGYDQCDPSRISDDLGGEAGFRELVATARAHRLGVLLDIVPNHMATSHLNPWWWELLRSGKDGRAGDFFDIDWEIPDADLRGRVLLPVLGAPLDETIREGQLVVEDADDGPALRYYDQRFPLHTAPGRRGVGEILGEQHYLLTAWQEAAVRLNYRRFFAINSLVALREEETSVFVTLHEVAAGMVERGEVDGLRVDHVDGLRDPRGYLDNLRRVAPRAWLLVEKILEPGEHLPGDWAVEGTTGYDFIQRLGGVFMDPAGESPLTSLYQEFTGRHDDYATVVARAKSEVAARLFRPDVARLVRLLAARCAAAGVAASEAEMTAAVGAVAVALPVYRTYMRPGDRLSVEDRGRIDGAIASAGKDVDGGLLAILRGALLGEDSDPTGLELGVRFQQLSGPLMAKGVEDTAFYRYHRLVALSEVGASPGVFAVGVDEFHQASVETAERHPRGMLASSTHDTKRSEDVRARLSLLAQVPAEWAAAVHRWRRINDRHRGAPGVDPNDEYLLYQTLVGAWPLTRERALQFMEKAVREAAEHTTWTEPDAAYEQAVADFVTALMDDAEFQADLEAFVRPLVEPGRVLAVAQALVKLTAPGVGDVYQGTETWDLSLVDPDNRRPPDYGLRAELLAADDQAQKPGELDPGSHRWEEGLGKLHVIRQALALRRRQPAAFGPGSTYTALAAEGPASDNILAFARGTVADPLATVVAVPRFLLRGGEGMESTALRLPPGRWTDVLWKGPSIEGPDPALEAVFARHQVALLERA